MSRLLHREELIALISRIMAADGTETELDELLMNLTDLSPMPGVSDLIFYPTAELTASEIADMIMNYKPLL